MEASQLTKALSVVQGALPKVDKSKTAEVKMKEGGKYTYKYADLSDICEKLYPLLAENGLAWTTQPTINDAGRFVLLYSLRHEGGESIDGVYPLPSPDGRPQDTGSAITYARRYALCSVVGIVPDEDDDGQGAEQAYQRGHGKQAPAPAKQTQAQIDVISLLDEINETDDAGLQRFSDAEKKSMSAAWKKKYEFSAERVPVKLVDKVRTFIASFEGTEPQSTPGPSPEPNPQERSDEGAGDRAAQQAIDDLVSMFVGSSLGLSKQSARARTKEIWEASGYASQETVNSEEWAVLARMAELKIDDIRKAASTSAPS
jgi:hypothetical protein